MKIGFWTVLMSIFVIYLCGFVAGYAFGNASAMCAQFKEKYGTRTDD